jgi:mono/diheme cytochrome c family protein
MLMAAVATAFGVACVLEVVPRETAATTPARSTDPLVARGRYLVQIGGCNDCHTEGYLEHSGNVPEERWLLGSSLGFSGPWGTTYPSNLRRLLGTLHEDEWVRFARTLETRPPMPWFNLRAMAEGDLRAIYRYVRSLPEDDRSVPDYVPPGRAPATPHIDMTPRLPHTGAADPESRQETHRR